LEEKKVNRREFFKRAGKTGAVATGSIFAATWLLDSRSPAQYFRDLKKKGTKKLSSFQVKRETGVVTMAISRGKDLKKMVRAAFSELGGITAFISKGDTVLLKPNVAFDRAPILGATTNPNLIKQVALLCKEAGAKKIIIADNPINQPEGCFFKTGILKAAQEVGAEIILPKLSAFKHVEINGEVLKNWPMFYRPFQEANKVIGIAPCKDHNLCGGSMTMKNWYGLLGGQRNQFHQQIHDVISDFPIMIKPTLVVLDATRVLMRNGPTGGSLNDVADVNTLVVGTDMVAVDTFGYTLLGRSPEELEYLQKASARGLGSMDWKKQNWREIQVG
jgi:uncharacterized protein (DUF362 family)